MDLHSTKISDAHISLVHSKGKKCLTATANMQHLVLADCGTGTGKGHHSKQRFNYQYKFGKHKKPDLLPQTCEVHSGITFQQRLTAACSLDANMLAMHPRYATDPTADPLISRPVCNAVDLVRHTVLPRERRVIEYDDYRPILDSLADYALRV